MSTVKTSSVINHMKQRAEGAVGAGQGGVAPAVEEVSYLSESFCLRGAQRLVGQLQQLLWTLQSFGTGAQLTLENGRDTLGFSE